MAIAYAGVHKPPDAIRHILLFSGPNGSVEPLFDHEKLDVYCVGLHFTAGIADFLSDVSGLRPFARRFRKFIVIPSPASDLRSLFIGKAIEVTEENAVWIIFVAEVCQSFPVFG